MKHRAAPDFWRYYQSLPGEARTLADKSFEILKADPHHPSLHLKKVSRFWSVRVGLHHRALAIKVPDGLLWFWIGSHAEYDSIVG